MSKNRDNDPGYIFCNAETHEALYKKAELDGTAFPPGEVFVIADIIPYGYCVVATKDEFLGWLFDRDNDHDVWNVPEDKA